MLFVGHLLNEMRNAQKRKEREADEDQENRDECLETSQRSAKGKGGRRTEVIGYLWKATSMNLVVGAITLSSNLHRRRLMSLMSWRAGMSDPAYFLKASVTDCALTSNCGQSSSSWSKGSVMFVTVVERCT